MNQHANSPEFEDKIRMAMATAIPSQEHLKDLRKQVLEKARTKTLHPHRRRANYAPAWSLVTISTVLMVVLLIGPPKVYAAFKQLLGYIPGIGLVEQDKAVRVLQQPIQQVYGDAIFTIEQVYLDETVSIVNLSFEGFPGDALPLSEGCIARTGMHLPDGQSVSLVSELGGGSSDRKEFRLEFQPIPQDVDQAVISVPCLRDAVGGSSPENQLFHLQFVPAGSQLDSTVVIQLPTTTPLPLPTASSEASAPETVLPIQTTQRIDTSSIKLWLYQLAAFDGGFVLYAGLDWDPNIIQFAFPINARLLDANGREIPFSYVDPGLAVETSQAMQCLALQASQAYTSGPLTLVVDGMAVTVPVEAEDIIFDIGDNPYNGPWEIDQDIAVAGHTITIVSVDAITVDGVYPGFEFTIETDGMVDMPELADKDHETIGFGGGPRGEQMTVFVFYEDGWPFGQNTFTLESLKIYLEGAWEASWENQ